MSRNATTHSTLTKLVLKLSANKEEYQRKLDTGEIESIVQLAKLEGVAYNTMRKLCQELEIVGPRVRIRKDKRGCSLDAIISVIHRICVELKIDHRELLPYLHNNEHTTTEKR